MSALHFEGERSLPIPVEPLWAKLSDAGFLAGCIPDGHIEGTPAPSRAISSVRPGLSFIRGNLDVTLEVVDAHQPDLIHVRVTGKGVGSSSVVETRLQLVPAGNSTTVSWQADIQQLTGLLKMVPAGLIRGAAQKVIDDVWNGIATHLDSPR